MHHIYGVTVLDEEINLKISLTFMAVNRHIIKQCKDYWAQDNLGEFTHDVDVAAKIAGKNKKKLTELVRNSCIAVIDSEFLNCKQCGKPSIFTTREQLEFVSKQQRAIYYNYDEWTEKAGISGLPRSYDKLLDVCSECDATFDHNKELAQQEIFNVEPKHQKVITKTAPEICINLKIESPKELSQYTALEAWLLLCLNQTFKTRNIPERVYRKSQTPFFGSERNDFQVLTQLYSHSLIEPSEPLTERASKSDYLNATWSFVLPSDNDHSNFINTLVKKQVGLTPSDIETLSEFIIEGRVRAMMDPINSNTGYWRVFGNTKDIKLNSALKNLIQIFPINHVEALSNIAAKDLAAKYHRTYNHLQKNANLYLAGIIRYSELAQSDKGFKFYDRSNFFNYEPTAFEKQLSVFLQITTPLGEVQFAEFTKKLVQYVV